MTHTSAPSLLTLHAVRLAGYADESRILARFGLDRYVALGALMEADVRGWAQHTAFAGLEGWSLTESGRVMNETQLADELAQVDGRGAVEEVYREFLPLNARLVRAVTEWQVRPTAADRLAANDHSDPAWDARILAELTVIVDALTPLSQRLAGVLARFEGYEARFRAALECARSGDLRWVDRSDIDSCHRVWFELHEDLVATLGIDRRSETSP